MLNRFRSWPARVVALLAAGAVLLLIVAFGLAVLSPQPPDPRIPKVAAAVHATFPTICRTAGYKIIVAAGSQPDSFVVRCDPNLSYMGTSPLLTINIVSCRIMATESMDMMEDYPELYGMPLLANCPLQ